MSLPELLGEAPQNWPAHWLRADWVQRIFDRMEIRYGALWMQRWGGCDLAKVQAGWAQELGGFRDQPERIAHALTALAGESLPPTLPEFIAACRRAPGAPAGPALPHFPTADDLARAAQAAEAARRATSAAAPSGPNGKAVYEAIARRVEAGERVPYVARKYAEEVLGRSILRGGRHAQRPDAKDRQAGQADEFDAPDMVEL